MSQVTYEVDDSTAGARVVVTTDKPILDSKGVPTGEMQSRKWTTYDARHSEAHIATWTDPKIPQAERLSPGDASALADRVNAAQKQIES